MHHRFLRRALLGVLAALSVVAASCDPPPPAPRLDLPGGLDLRALPEAQQGLLRATLAVSGGALAETELTLDVAAGTVAGSFTLQNVTEETDRTLTLRVYGRAASDSAEVTLGELNQTITLRPGEDTAVDFGADDAFETCEAGADGRCALRFDENRNGTTNINDLLPTSAGGLGIDPAPQAPFLVTSASQLQFPSGVRLGTFARQLVVLENFGDNAASVVSAAVVGGQGFSLSILDPAGLSVATPARALDASSFPAAINPAEEAFVAVSFAPVNNFVTTGTLFIVAEDSVTHVRQTARVKLIANPEGGLRPADPDYVEPVIDGDVLAATTGEMPVIAFPTGPLHSGEPLTADDVDDGGIRRSGAELVLGTAPDVTALPADFGFVVDIAPKDRLSMTLDGLTSDIDLALVDVDGAALGGLTCEACVSRNAGESPEAIEFLNTGTSTRRVVIMLSRIDLVAAADVTSAVPFRLSAALTRGPEFDTETPINPTTGPQEGGLLVQLRGTGFDARATVTVGGAPALDTVFVTDDSGVDVVTFTLPAQQGTENPATVVVENPGVDVGGDGQAATLPEGFRFQPPAPVLEELRPDLAPTTGGTAPITIVGRFFSARHGPPRVIFKDTATGATVPVDATFVSASTLTVLAPPSTTPTVPGTVQVKVANRLEDDVAENDLEPILGAASNGLALRYLVPAGAAPTLTSVSPAEGTIDGDTTVVLTGTGLRAGVEVFFDGTAALCAPPTDTAVSCRTPTRDVDGVVDVVVFNSDGQSATLADAFTYTIPAPTIASTFPARASVQGGTLVVVAGGGFRAGATASFRRDGTSTVAVATRVSATTMLVTTPPQAAGDVELVIANVDGQTATASFVIFAPDQEAPPPSIVSVSPGSGDAAGGYEVVIEGQDFRNPQVVFGSTVVSGVFTDATAPDNDRLTVVAPPSPTSVGAVVDIQLTNDDGQSDSQPWIYTFVPALAPRVDSVTPALLPGDATTTVTISGQRFDATGARVLVRGQAVPVTSRSATRITANINTRQLPAGPTTLVVENPDGTAAAAAIEVLPAGAPRLLSVSVTSLHARVAGDTVVVLGEQLDQGTLSATLKAGAPGVAGVAVDAACRVVSRTASVVVLEVPALGAGTHFLELAFVAGSTTTTLQSGAIVANDPVIAFTSSRPRGQLTELTILGDALNPNALVGVDLVDFGGRAIDCIVSAATEGLVRCTSASALLPATGYVARLRYAGTFDGVTQLVDVDGVDIGFDDPVGGDPVVGDIVTAIPSNTDFAQVPVDVDVVTAGLDPAGLPAVLDATVFDDSGRAVASGFATATIDSATVSLDAGVAIDDSNTGTGTGRLDLSVDGVVVATMDVSLSPRRIASVNFGFTVVTWPAPLNAIIGAFVDGDSNRLVAVHPTEPVALPLVGTAISPTTSRVQSTRPIPAGAWRLCLADQVVLANAKLCVSITVQQRAVELEPNDTDVDASTIALNALGDQPTSVSGTLPTAVGDVDDRFFFFAPSEAQRVKLTLSGRCDPFMTMTIRARDDDTVLETFTSQGGCFVMESDLPGPGQYVVSVTGTAPSYALSAQIIPPRICGDGIITPDEQCDDGFGRNVDGGDCNANCSEPGEPDNVIPVPVDETSNTFRTLTPKDVDTFEVTLLAPTLFGAGTVLRNGQTSNNDCQGRMRITLQTPTGLQLGSDVTTGNFACPFVNVLVGAGTYIVKVEATDPADIIPYRLFTFPDPSQPAPSCGNDIIEGTEQCDSSDPTCEACAELDEDNGAIAGATPLPPGGGIFDRALGQPAGDIDFFALPDQGATSANLTLERLDGQLCAGGLAIDLLDSVGTVIDSDVSSGPNGCPELFIDAVTGPLFLRVAATTAPLVTPYRLSVFDLAP